MVDVRNGEEDCVTRPAGNWYAFGSRAFVSTNDTKHRPAKQRPAIGNGTAKVAVSLQRPMWRAVACQAVLDQSAGLGDAGVVRRQILGVTVMAVPLAVTLSHRPS